MFIVTFGFVASVLLLLLDHPAQVCGESKTVETPAIPKTTKPQAVCICDLCHRLTRLGVERVISKTRRTGCVIPNEVRSHLNVALKYAEAGELGASLWHMRLAARRVN